MSVSLAAAAVLDARKPARAIVLAGATVVAIAAYSLVLTIFILPTNVDVSWLVTAGDRLLQGDRLHVDLVETNPPFSIWLYMPFVALDHATGLAAETWLSIGLAAVALASVLLSAHILASADPAYRRKRFIWIIPAAYFTVLFLSPNDFGQREQIAVIAILPWLAMIAARDRDQGFRGGTWPQAIIAGIGAAIVVMIKPPYYTLAIVVPSCVMALQRRSFRPLFVTENIIGAAIVFLYIGYLLAFHWTYFDLFLNLLRPIYLPLREPLADMLEQPATLFFMAVAAIAAAGGALHRDVKLLFLPTFGFGLAFFIMGKGWDYQALPFITLGLLALVLQLFQLGAFALLPPFRKTGAVLGVLFALFLPAAFRLEIQAEGMESKPEKINRAAAAILQAVDHPTVVSISAWHQSAHPLVRSMGGRFISRHPSAWAIYNAEMLIRREEDPDRKEQLKTLRNALTADIAAELGAKRPDVVIYDEKPKAFWPHLILENPAIAAELSKYRVLYRDGSATYYIRSDLAGKN